MRYFCIGDSHISYFTNKDTIIPVSQWFHTENFNVFNVGPWLCYNLPNNIGITLQLLQDITSEDIIIFCFGEIDCRAQVIKRAKIKSQDEIIQEIVHNYFQFLTAVRYRYSNTILLFCAIPCYLEQPFKEYYDQHTDSFDYPCGTLNERNKIKEKFNNLVNDNCNNIDIKFLSIYDDIIEEHYIDDIHLNPIKVFPIIKEKLCIL